MSHKLKFVIVIVDVTVAVDLVVPFVIIRFNVIKERNVFPHPGVSWTFARRLIWLLLLSYSWLVVSTLLLSLPLSLFFPASLLLSPSIGDKNYSWHHQEFHHDVYHLWLMIPFRLSLLHSFVFVIIIIFLIFSMIMK